MNNPLLDNEFLTQLMEYRQREIFARITLLTKDELPIEYIEGRVTGGSINVDGNSALRRTCNLTMILKNKAEVNQFHWTFKSKFKLEIGLKNMINSNYPDIIWFRQGVFILTTCNMNQTTNNYTITINGKDKMCLLNGDLGGNLTSSVDFGVEEYYDKVTGEITYNKIILKDIIRNAVQTFGGELPENIIINDLDQAGLELLEYRGQTVEGEDLPLYLLRNINDGLVDNATLDPNFGVYLEDATGEQDTTSIGSNTIVYATMSDLFSGDFDKNTATKVTLNYLDNIKYNVIKLTYGDLAGYRLTDLTYAGELKANVGETIVSILDKIKKMLSDFEYFYNLDGKFIFQKKRTYVSTPWGGQEQNINDAINLAINDSYPKINLTNAQLTTAFANNPNLLNVKNDFSVWGTYKSISGADIPIHMRYAIDTKPIYYKTIRSIWTRKANDPTAEPPDDYEWYRQYAQDETKNGMTYTYLTQPFSTVDDGKSIVVDWREIIYQMAADYYKDSNWITDDFCLRVAAANPIHYPSGKTGYEQYYSDIQGFWRNLYDPQPTPSYEEIAAADLPTDPKDCYVDHYYTIIANEDDIANYDLKDLYIITTLDGNEAVSSGEKLVFTPFIGSKACCLTAGTEYFYYTGKNYEGTTDESKLNLRDLTEIYYKIPSKDTYDLIVKQKQQEWIEDNYKITGTNHPLHRFWIKKDERAKIDDLLSYCDFIYRNGQKYLQYLSRWDYLDNYGNLTDSSSTSPAEVIERITYSTKIVNGDYNELHWNKMVQEDPNSLIFWFDFLETEGSDLYKYSVKEIGVRTKAINDSNVKSIYYRDVPNVIFTSDFNDQSYPKQTGYTYIQISSAYESLFSISGRGKSAKERIDELLQEHSYVAEQANITTVPLYHLEPNTRIAVRDEMSNIDGEYIITKFTIPLAHNGTMSLTTTKVVSNIM